jgi:hypothetical protein
MPESNRKSKDWEQEAEMLRQELATSWGVEVSQELLVAQKMDNKGHQVVQTTARFESPPRGWPKYVRTLVRVDYTYLAPTARAFYFGLYQLWAALEALEDQLYPPTPS